MRHVVHYGSKAWANSENTRCRLCCKKYWKKLIPGNFGKRPKVIKFA